MADIMSESYFPTLTPYIVVKDASAAISFYEKALGAVARDISKTPDGKIMNAQLVIGDSVLMLNDEFPDYGSFGPKENDCIPVTIHIHSKDVENDWKRAVDAGMTITMPLEDMFWGDRYGQLKCPFGFKWSMAQRMSNPSEQEMAEAMKQAFAEKP